jgi:protein JSN1
MRDAPANKVVITQTSEPGASTTLINAIFTSPQDETLYEVLSDANNGAQVIGKLLAIGSIAQADKDMMSEAVRRAMPRVKAASTPPYRVLLESVGLPVPPPSGPSPGPGQGPRGPNRNQRGPWQGGPQHGQQQPFQYGGFSQNPYHQQQQHQQHYQQHNMNLSPLLVPQNMAIGQMRAGQGGHSDSLDPNLTPMQGHSPRTPVPHPHRPHLPGHQMMSPTSDPFNPVCRPLFILFNHRREALTI